MNQPTPSGRGGARPGAGRPPGSTNKINKSIREAAAASGDLPHEILLKMARGLPVRTMVDSGTKDENGDPIFVEKWVALEPEGVRDAAKAAAPYFAPKLSTVETITGLTDEQLDEIIERAAAEAAAGAGNDGEGTQSAPTQPSTPRRRIRLET